MRDDYAMDTPGLWQTVNRAQKTLLLFEKFTLKRELEKCKEREHFEYFDEPS
jgi:hypothetical protein